MDLWFAARDGSIDVHLDDNLRDLLRKISEELREILLVDDAELTRRLYPTAYPDDAELDQEYQGLVRDQLLMQRLEGIDQLQASIGDAELSLELAEVWMTTINQARLVLGTQLDVSEDDGRIDPDEPAAAAKTIYQVLSLIMEELTSARMELL